jgi:hypothetical protein
VDHPPVDIRDRALPGQVGDRHVNGVGVGEHQLRDRLTGSPGGRLAHSAEVPSHELAEELGCPRLVVADASGGHVLAVVDDPTACGSITDGQEIAR